MTATAKERIQGALHAVEERVDAARRAVKAKTGLRDPVRPLPYRGWGADGALHLRGRVLEDEGIQDIDGDGLAGRLWKMWKRYESDEIPGAELEVRLGDRVERLETDEEGFFTVELEGVPLEAPWTELEVRLRSPLNDDQDNPPVTGCVRVAGPNAKRAIVSDIDDTIVKTGATSFLKHARTVLLNEATPVISGLAMETITETIITESTMIGHNPTTPGGEGLGDLAVTDREGSRTHLSMQVDGPL